MLHLPPVPRGGQAVWLGISTVQYFCSCPSEATVFPTESLAKQGAVGSLLFSENGYSEELGHIKQGRALHGRLKSLLVIFEDCFYVAVTSLWLASVPWGAKTVLLFNVNNWSSPSKENEESPWCWQTPRTSQFSIERFYQKVWISDFLWIIEMLGLPYPSI